MQHLLIIAYEYLGYHSKQGAALARRITQVAESFNANNWKVTVIHCDRINETGNNDYVERYEKNGIRRIAVKEKNLLEKIERISFFRKLLTICYTYFYGDRSYWFARQVLKHYNKLDIGKVDILLSFFTPKGPTYAAKNLSDKYKIKWIADLQDPLSEGLSSDLNKQLGYIWFKDVLKSAFSITHVSPEWAEIDSKFIDRKIHVIRHAIPFVNKQPAQQNENKKFTIFYGGSLDPQIQSLGLLNKTLQILKNDDIKIVLASDESTYRVFMNNLDGVEIDYKGWLDYDAYQKELYDASCALIVPWNTTSRVGIPSKFYDVCQTGKPIWIIGEDSGAFKSLLNELEHPQFDPGDVAYQVEAIKKALEGDFSKMFTVQNCKGEILTEDKLYDKYMELL